MLFKRYFSLVTFIIIPCFLVHAQNQVTVTDVINKIKSNVTCNWADVTVDNIKAGDEQTKVTGIATTFMATLEVLQKAKAAGCNFVISHEPTFYNHNDDLTLHKGDPVQEAKLKFIKDNNMVVWRFHDHLHQTNPDQVYEGVLTKLDWKKYQSNGHFLKFPAKSLKNIVTEIEQKLNAKTVRVVGNPDMVISNVGLALGASGSNSHFKLLSSPDCELLIVGESNEWETVPYVQDAITIGQKKALIVLGHADSEEAGMDYTRTWLQKFYPNLKVKFIEAGNPYWRN
ncbi:MAG: hypothetical protein JWN56_1535 [Sphingobacteriales bacterium]|nr:hypothetical protein [Sphingobacteriales bacterium]